MKQTKQFDDFLSDLYSEKQNTGLINFSMSKIISAPLMVKKQTAKVKKKHDLSKVLSALPDESHIHDIEEILEKKWHKTVNQAKRDITIFEGQADKVMLTKASLPLAVTTLSVLALYFSVLIGGYLPVVSTSIISATDKVILGSLGVVNHAVADMRIEGETEEINTDIVTKELTTELKSEYIKKNIEKLKEQAQEDSIPVDSNDLFGRVAGTEEKQ